MRTIDTQFCAIFSAAIPRTTEFPPVAKDRGRARLLSPAPQDRLFFRQHSRSICTGKISQIHETYGLSGHARVPAADFITGEKQAIKSILMPAEANGTGIALPDSSVNPFAAYPMERIPDYCGFGGVNGENSCFPLTPACGQSINTFSTI